MKWGIQIDATSLEVRNLRDLLAGIGVDVSQDGDHLTLRSARFDALESSDEVWEEGKRLASAIAGPTGIDPEFKLGAVVDGTATPPRRIHKLEAKFIIGKPPVVDSPELTVLPPAELSSAELDEWTRAREEQKYQDRLEEQREQFEPAYSNPAVNKVLELLQSEVQTGVTLYEIYELMEGHPSNRNAFHSQLAISEEEFNRFKDVVHNQEVSGQFARHRYSGGKRNSTDPMSEAEAIQFIQSLVDRWLDEIRKDCSK